MAESTTQKYTGGNDKSIITIISTCHGLSHFYQLAAPSLYIIISPALSLSYSDLGASLVVFGLVSSAGQPLAGIISDKIGALALLIYGTIIYATGIALISLSQGLLTIMAASAIAGLGNSIYHPCDFSILNQKVTHSKLPIAYSFHVIGGQIGWSLAPITMIALANIFDWRMALLIVSIPGFVLSGILFVYRNHLKYELQTKYVDNKPVAGQSFLKMLRMPWIWTMLIFFAMHSMATMPIPQFGQIIFQNLFQLSKEILATYASLFLLASAVGTILGGIILGKKISGETVTMADYRQFTTANTIAMICMFIAGVAYSSMAFLPSYLLLLPLVIAGFSVGMTSPSRDSLVRIMTRGKDQGKAYGIIYSGLDIGMLFVPAVMGVLIDNKLAAATLAVPVAGCWLAVLTIMTTKKHSQCQAEVEAV